MRTDRRIMERKMTKLIVAFHNFSKAPKNARTHNSSREIARKISFRKVNKDLHR